MMRAGEALGGPAVTRLDVWAGMPRAMSGGMPVVSSPNDPVPKAGSTPVGMAASATTSGGSSVGRGRRTDWVPTSARASGGGTASWTQTGPGGSRSHGGGAIQSSSVAGVATGPVPEVGTLRMTGTSSARSAPGVPVTPSGLEGTTVADPVAVAVAVGATPGASPAR